MSEMTSLEITEAETKKRKADSEPSMVLNEPKKPRARDSIQSDGLAALEQGSTAFDAWIKANKNPGDLVLRDILEMAEAKHNRKDWACVLRAISDKYGDDPEEFYYAKRAISAHTRAELKEETQELLAQVVDGLAKWSDRDQAAQVFRLAIQDVMREDVVLSVVVMLSALGSSMSDDYGRGRVPREFQPILSEAIARFIQSQFEESGSWGFTAAIYSLDRFAPLWRMAIDTLDVWRHMHVLSRDAGEFNHKNYQVLCYRHAARSNERGPGPSEFITITNGVFAQTLDAIKFGLDLASRLDSREPLVVSISRGLVLSPSEPTE